MAALRCSIVLGTIASGCSHPTVAPASPISRDDRSDAIARAAVWRPIDVAAADIRRGPADDRGFTPGETVTCDFVDKTFSGASPKFACAITPEDVVKVKYGHDNGEVFAEVAATRLLWALGFGADHEYPVRVVCHGCSREPVDQHEPQDGTVVFDYAAIERKMPGHALGTTGVVGWKWPELDLVSENAGGAPKAQRDAQQLLACDDPAHGQQARTAASSVCSASRATRASCAPPFMTLNDARHHLRQVEPAEPPRARQRQP